MDSYKKFLMDISHLLLKAADEYHSHPDPIARMYRTIYDLDLIMQMHMTEERNRDKSCSGQRKPQ
jgi:hypothetical protein